MPRTTTEATRQVNEAFVSEYTPLPYWLAIVSFRPSSSLPRLCHVPLQTIAAHPFPICHHSLTLLEGCLWVRHLHLSRPSVELRHLTNSSPGRWVDTGCHEIIRLFRKFWVNPGSWVRVPRAVWNF